MARARPAGPTGLALVDKAPGWTSHDVVAKLRGILGTRKVGHAGTLDPPATGLLLVGSGHMTRLLRFLTAQRKTYVGEVVLGVETDTLDDTGTVTARHDAGGIGVAELRAAAAGLTGDIMQVPPMVSAVKVEGRRLHEIAREGGTVERDARPVTVFAFEIGDAIESGVHPIHVECSAGTYVRSLAADLGRAAGTGAHLRHLRRTASGRFRVADAVPVEAVDPARLLPPAAALADLTQVVVDPELARAVGHGAVLDRDDLGLPPAAAGPFAVLDRDQRLLAVYEPHDGGRVKPAVVVPTGSGAPGGR